MDVQQRTQHGPNYWSWPLTVTAYVWLHTAAQQTPDRNTLLCAWVWEEKTLSLLLYSISICYICAGLGSGVTDAWDAEGPSKEEKGWKNIDACGENTNHMLSAPWVLFTMAFHLLLSSVEETWKCQMTMWHDKWGVVYAQRTQGASKGMHAVSKACIALHSAVL